MANQPVGSQMRITPTEMSILKNTFKGNEELVRLMRKLFLPELEAYPPIGQNIDLWMTIPVDQLTPEQAIINLKARNSLIMHLESVLNQIKVLAELEDEPNPATLKKNSSK